MKKKILLILLLLVVIATGCGTKSKSNNSSGKEYKIDQLFMQLKINMMYLI